MKNQVHFEHKCKLMKATSIAETNNKKKVLYSTHQAVGGRVEHFHLPPHPVHPRPDRCLQPPPQQHTGSRCFREDLKTQ